MAGSPLFGPFGVPLILDKLAASSGETQVVFLRLLSSVFFLLMPFVPRLIPSKLCHKAWAFTNLSHWLLISSPFGFDCVNW